MKIGASQLIRAWGRQMSLERDGSVLLSFKGRLVEARPELEQLDNSFDQENFRVIALAEDFGTIRPRKFDVVIYEGERYTVQRGHSAGADEDELIKMSVKGGIT